MNFLYKLDASVLFNSKKENNEIICSQTTCDMAKSIVSKRDCLLFDQINKIKKTDMLLSEILVIIDFKDFISTKKMIDLINYHSFKLTLNKLDGEEESDDSFTIDVVDFLKSNSMSKECQLYYINKNCLTRDGNNLYEELKERVFFDFYKNDSVLSKLYAYSGSMCSDCTLLENIKLKPDEIVVVNDKNEIIESDCITMISNGFLYNEIKKINKLYLEDYKEKSIAEILKHNACRELDAIYKSLNLAENCNIPEELKEIVRKYSSIDKSSKEQLKKGVSKLLDEYSYIDTGIDEVKWYRMKVNDYPFDLNLFDGEGLVSKEFVEELRNELCNKLGNDKYKNSNSFQLRLPYVKGMVHSVDIKKFFKSKNIKYIEHVKFPKDKKYDVNKVKLILTESQFKASSFMNQSSIKTVADYINKINEYDYPIGIIDCDKEEKNKCSLEYQFISTLPLSIKDIAILYDNTKWNINNACSADNVIEQLKHDDKAEKEYEICKLSKDFYSATKKFKDRRRNIYNSLKNKAKFCKFEVLGTRRYLSGDLLELLYHVAYNNYNEFDDSKWLYKNHYYMPSKKSKSNIAIFLRSPHYSRNEIVALKRRPVELIDEREEYFGHLTGVVMINPRSLAADRLGGADYDGDTVLIVNDNTIVNSVLNNIIRLNDKESRDDGLFKYSYLPCKIPSLKGKRTNYNNYKDRLECFQNTFSSRVGILSNQGFKRATWVYGNVNSSDNDHNMIAEYTILNGLEIDSAKSGKKPFIVNLINNNDKDNKYNLFLEAKSEFDNKGTLTKFNHFISQCYSDYKDVTKYSSDLKEYEKMNQESFIEDYNEIDYTNNVLNVVCNMNKIDLFQKDLGFQEDIKNNKNEITSDEKIKIMAIYMTYIKINRLIHTSFNAKGKLNKKIRKNKLYEQIEEILKTKGISLDEFINVIDIDNLKANTMLNEYVDDSKYHYLKTIEEREKYLNKLFVDLIDNKDVLECFTSFESDGYRLLFMFLQYHKMNIEKFKIYVSNDECKKFYTKFHDLKDDKDKFMEFNNLYQEYCKNIENIINDNISRDEATIKKLICDYLSEEAKDLTLYDLSCITNVYESNITFDIFYNQLKSYLENENENEKNCR